MKRIISIIMAAFIFALTGCADVETDKGNATIPTKATTLADNSQVPIAEQKSATDNEGISTAQEEQEGKLAEIFDALNELEYQPYTCDGLPEYRLTAADGTVYAINVSEKWVWRGNSEQTELSDELITQLKEISNLITSDKPLEIPSITLKLYW